MIRFALILSIAIVFQGCRPGAIPESELAPIGTVQDRGDFTKKESTFDPETGSETEDPRVTGSGITLLKPTYPSRTMKDLLNPPQPPAPGPSPILAPNRKFPDVGAVAAAHTAFAFKLYRQVAARTKGNVLIAPYGVSSVLGMLHEGAGGETEQELQTLAGAKLTDSRRFRAQTSLSNWLEKIGVPVGMRSRRGLWLAAGVPAGTGFREACLSMHRGEIRLADFELDGMAAGQINARMQAYTGGVKFVPPEHLDASTRLYACSAEIFARLRLAQPFTARDTRVMDWRPGSKGARSQAFLRQVARVPFFAGAGVKALMLPLASERLSMWLLLPESSESKLLFSVPAKEFQDSLEKKVFSDDLRDAFKSNNIEFEKNVKIEEIKAGEQGKKWSITSETKSYVAGRQGETLNIRSPDYLGRLEKALTPENLNEWQSLLLPRQVRVSIPRLAMRGTYDLALDLRDLGLRRTFSPATAEFPRIAEREQVWLGGLRHYAAMSLSERGRGAGPSPDQHDGAEFDARQPFVFLIRDSRTGSVLLMGRVVDPRG